MITISHRHDLGHLLEILIPKGVGVEVGVQQGLYSDFLLQNWKSGTLHCVDRWMHVSDYIDIANKSQEEQELLYQETKERLSKYGERCKIIRMDSVEASKLYEDESLDFVYIDADHSYEGCFKDLEAWYPKVRKGGIFAGHDYINAIFPETIFGVKSAVDKFLFDKKKLNQLKVIPDTNGFPTFILIK